MLTEIMNSSACAKNNAYQMISIFSTKNKISIGGVPLWDSDVLSK